MQGRKASKHLNFGLFHCMTQKHNFVCIIVIAKFLIDQVVLWFI